MKPHLGKIHIYTGKGEGKTRAALGLAMRALGYNYKVLIVQFMKGRESGERKVAERLRPDLSVYNFGSDGFIIKGKVSQEDKEEAEKGLHKANELIKKNKPDILILDEILVALDFGLLDGKKVIEFINSKPEGLEIVLTGRGATSELIKRADLVTEMKEVKHYYKNGVQARKGVEY